MQRLVLHLFLLSSENSVTADLIRMGPEELTEVNCNGHVEADQRESQWREEDQHNGNTEPREKCASEDEQRNESPVYPVCNGVDAACFKELDTEIEGGGAHSSGITERQLPAGLEEGELGHSILQEDGSDCQYSADERMRNGQYIRYLRMLLASF